MKLRGNHVLFFILELASGLATFAGTLLWGDLGLLGLALFFAAMIVTHKQPDEREMMLLYKATALEACAMGAIMAIIYFRFPAYNWFHGFVSFGLITRGLIGTIAFARE
jgi:hypothetical protein